MDAHFNDPVPNRLGITQVSEFCPVNASLNPRPPLEILQFREPFVKGGSRVNAGHGLLYIMGYALTMGVLAN
jgi:hypothetical protein